MDAFIWAALITGVAFLSFALGYSFRGHREEGTYDRGYRDGYVDRTKLEIEHDMDNDIRKWRDEYVKEMVLDDDEEEDEDAQ